MVLSPRLLSFRRPAGRSVSSFSVIACTFPCNKCFQPALAPTLAGIWFFRLPIASRHVFSGHVHLEIPADTKQHTVTSLRTSPVRLSQPLTETKYCRDGRRYFHKNHYNRELTSGVSNWAFSGTLSTSAKSHSSSYGSFYFILFFIFYNETLDLSRPVHLNADNGAAASWRFLMLFSSIPWKWRPRS